MISNTKHDGTHKTPENVDPRLHTPLDRRKLTLAQSKERSSNKNAFFPITHSNYQPSHATHTSKPFLSDAHISLFYPRFKKNTEENATPIFFVLSLSLSLWPARPTILGCRSLSHSPHHMRTVTHICWPQKQPHRCAFWFLQELVASPVICAGPPALKSLL